MVDNISSLSFPLSSPPPLHPPPPLSQKTNLPMLYYGLAVVGTAAILLAVYNLIIIKWCTQRRGRSGQRRDGFLEITSSRSLEYSYGNLLSSFKYEKDNMGVGVRGSDHECAVCLSVFEDGEEVKQLPRCKHSFHAPCIDMWLYSHSDCPLCRSRVDPPLPLCHSRRPTAAAAAAAQHNSREELLDHSAISNSNSTVSV